jgi:hypothetical protein
VTEKPRPVVLCSPSDAELIAATVEQLQREPALQDQYDLAALTFLCNRLGATPRAVISKALATLVDKQHDPKPRRKTKRE